MEAVGRLASEVAVTCDTLLRDVTQEGEQWLAAIGSDPMLRQQGEQLLREVTRAASFLRQLGRLRQQQVSALEPVTVHRVLRDLSGCPEAGCWRRYRADPSPGPRLRSKSMSTRNASSECSSTSPATLASACRAADA